MGLAKKQGLWYNVEVCIRACIVRTLEPINQRSMDATSEPHTEAVCAERP